MLRFDASSRSGVFNREGRKGIAKAAKKIFLGLVFFASLAAFFGELRG
jgi:hypothetical protein